jgi:hypothetical protein
MAYDGNDMMNSWVRVFGSAFTRQCVADCMGMNIRTVDRLISGRRESFPGLDVKTAAQMREIASELLEAAALLDKGGSPSSREGGPTSKGGSPSFPDVADLDLTTPHPR